MRLFQHGDAAEADHFHAQGEELQEAKVEEREQFATAAATVTDATAASASAAAAEENQC